MEFFLTLFNGWNSLTNLKESSTLDGMEVLDICLWSLRATSVTKLRGKSLCNSERNQQKISSLSSLKFGQQHIAPHRIVR